MKNQCLVSSYTYIIAKFQGLLAKTEEEMMTIKSAPAILARTRVYSIYIFVWNFKSSNWPIASDHV